MHRVLVAMSGGVDSSAAAALLVEEGYEVIGVTMRLWRANGNDGLQGRGSPCRYMYWNEKDARRVAERLRIAHHVLNLEDEFHSAVIARFIEAYASGRTPNPCIWCNQHMKFGHLLRRAEEMGFDFIATGHYAQVDQNPKTGLYELRCGRDLQKDQSYFLYRLTQRQLQHAVFPLGKARKEEAKRVAGRWGFSSTSRKESQDICFISGEDYRAFLLRVRPDLARPGDIVDEYGNILGEHKGIAFYTVGQRKGLGVARGYPVYVAEIDAERNVLRVGDARSLLTWGAVAHDVNWVCGEPVPAGREVRAKMRYNAPAAAAKVTYSDGEELVVMFHHPQKAVTPGQALVLYDGDEVLGGGTILRAIRDDTENGVRDN